MSKPPSKPAILEEFQRLRGVEEVAEYTETHDVGAIWDQLTDPDEGEIA